MILIQLNKYFNYKFNEMSTLFGHSISIVIFIKTDAEAVPAFV